MTPQAFIAKWRDNPLSERAGAQACFLDLCDVLGVDKLNDPDNYCFERGARFHHPSPVCGGGAGGEGRCAGRRGRKPRRWI